MKGVLAEWCNAINDSQLEYTRAVWPPVGLNSEWVGKPLIYIPAPSGPFGEVYVLPEAREPSGRLLRNAAAALSDRRRSL